MSQARPSRQCWLREVEGHRSYHHSERRLPGGRSRARGESGCWEARGLPPPPARSHTQGSLYGSAAGRALAVSASGKPGLGLLRGHNQAFVLPLAHPRPAGSPVRDTASRTQALPSGILWGWARRHHRGQQGTCKQHPTKSMFPTKTSLSTYDTVSPGITAEPATEEGDGCDHGQIGHSSLRRGAARPRYMPARHLQWGPHGEKSQVLPAWGPPQLHRTRPLAKESMNLSLPTDIWSPALARRKGRP